MLFFLWSYHCYVMTVINKSRSEGPESIAQSWGKQTPSVCYVIPEISSSARAKILAAVESERGESWSLEEETGREGAKKSSGKRTPHILSDTDYRFIRNLWKFYKACTTIYALFYIYDRFHGAVFKNSLDKPCWESLMFMSFVQQRSLCALVCSRVVDYKFNVI